MHTFLERLGRFCARHHWYVIGVWLVIVVGLVALRAAFGGSFVNNYTVPGSASDKGQAVLTPSSRRRAATRPDRLRRAGRCEAQLQRKRRQPVGHERVAPGSRTQRHEPVRDVQLTDRVDERHDRLRHGELRYGDEQPRQCLPGPLHNAVKPATDAGITVEYGGSAGQIASNTDDTKSRGDRPDLRVDPLAHHVRLARRGRDPTGRRRLQRRGRPVHARPGRGGVHVPDHRTDSRDTARPRRRGQLRPVPGRSAPRADPTAATM